MNPQVPGGKPPMDKKKKQQLAVGGVLVAAVAGFALWKSKGSGTAASSGSSSTPSTDSGSSTPYSYGGDGTGGDDESGLEDSLNTISEQLATITANENPPGTTTTSGAGPAPKKLDFWQQAIGALKRAGDKNPTSKQIGRERNVLREGAGLAPLTGKKGRPRTGKPVSKAAGFKPSTSTAGKAAAQTTAHLTGGISTRKPVAVPATRHTRRGH